MRTRGLAIARQWRSLEKARGAAGHGSASTADDCMRGFELKEVHLGLAVPKARKGCLTKNYWH